MSDLSDRVNAAIDRLSEQPTSWWELLHKGRLAGIDVHVDDSSMAGGRRGPDREYPGIDGGWPEDAGGKARRFSITVYITGLDAINSAKKLINKLDSGDLITYVDPWMGPHQVRCRAFDVAWRFAEGQVAVFALDLSVAGETAAFVTIDVPNSEVCFDAADLLEKVAENEFLQTAAKVQRTTKAVTAAVNQLRANLEYVVARIKSEVSGYIATVHGLRNSLLSLASFGEDTAGDIIDAIQSLSHPRDALRVAMTIGASLTPAVASTAQAQDVADAVWAANRLCSRGALAHAMRLSAQADYITYDDALKDRDDIATALLDSGDGATAQTYWQYMTAEAAELPRLVDHTCRKTTSTLELANLLYGSADIGARATEIRDRNRLSDTGFIPGGTTLRVLDR